MSTGIFGISAHRILYTENCISSVTKVPKKWCRVTWFCCSYIRNSRQIFIFREMIKFQIDCSPGQGGMKYFIKMWYKRAIKRKDRIERGGVKQRAAGQRNTGCGTHWRSFTSTSNDLEIHLTRGSHTNSIWILVSPVRIYCKASPPAVLKNNGVICIEGRWYIESAE